MILDTAPKSLRKHRLIVSAGTTVRGGQVLANMAAKSKESSFVASVWSKSSKGGVGTVASIMKQFAQKA